MSMTEILDALPRLDDSERQTILRRLVSLDAGLDIDETPEKYGRVSPCIRARHH